MAQVHEKERQLTREVAQTVEQGLPGVEVLAVELSGPERFTVYIDHPTGVDHALCERVTGLLRGYLDRYTVDVSSPGIERPLRTPAHFRNAVGRKVAIRTETRHRRPEEVPRHGRRRRAERSRARGRRPRARDHPVRRDRPGQPRRRRALREMSREIIEAVKTIEREKGIEEDTLINALEDALLAAYKKTPGSSRHATVELDTDSGDFRVFSIELPADIEERLIEEARERAIEELEAQEVETGEHSHVLISDDDLQIDWSDIDPAVVKRADVTPENFGRIAAQTAKQVILQRIREAEREMMYEEYIDRVGEVVTGIVQQAGDRNNVLVDLGKVESLLPRSEQVDGERYEQGSRIKAVITEVRVGHQGPAGDPLPARPGADPDAVRARGAGDRRRTRRDPRRRPRAGLPLEDRGRVARPGRRPGRRLRRPARLASAHGRLRAPRREDRHHPVEQRAGPLRREGALAGPRPRGLHRRRDQGGDRRRPRRPACAGDRQGGPERPPRRAPDRLEGRHPVGHGVRAGRGGGCLRRRRRRRLHRPLRRDPLEPASAARTPRCPARASAGSPAHQELAQREAAGEDLGDQIVQPGAAEDEEPEGEETANGEEQVSTEEPSGDVVRGPSLSTPRAG